MSLPFAILGLLSHKDMSGYDLKTSFDATVKCVWPAHLSQIYRDLGTMEKKSWVTSYIEPQETRPDRKVYSITETGKKELLHWLNTSPQNFSTASRDEMGLRMFLGSQVKIDEMLFQLKMFMKEKKQTLDFLNVMLESIKSGPFENEKKFWLFTVRKAIKVAEAELSWAEECFRELRQDS